MPEAAKELMLELVNDDALPFEQERAAVERLIDQEPETELSLLPLYVRQKHRYKEELVQLGKDLRQLPWHPATFIRPVGETGDQALVAAGGRRLVVKVRPPVDATALRCGTPVFLGNEMKALIGLGDEPGGSGAVGVVARMAGGLAVLRGPGDERLVVEVADDLLACDVAEGDHLVYDRESLVATGRVERAGQARMFSEEIPEVTFESIGGLSECIEEIQAEVTLHAVHGALAARHHLRAARGIILSGPPGCGKTMIARALGHYLAAQQGLHVRFVNVKPGAHRSKWYGETEQNIRELFAVARRDAAADGHFVVMFFDDADHLGARGEGAATVLDARVLPSFLAEIDALPDRVWLIAATNRPDLLDEALLRPGRFGDKVFRIPRPDRRGARQIFRKHLEPGLPYAGANGGGPEAAIDEMIEAALGMLYAPNGEAFALGHLVFRDGSRRALTAPELMSGALIAEAVAEAKRQSCHRAIRGEPVGLAIEDLLQSLDRQLRDVTTRLRPGPALRSMLELPEDLDVVKVEVAARRHLPASHEYIRIS